MPYPDFVYTQFVFNCKAYKHTPCHAIFFDRNNDQKVLEVYKKMFPVIGWPRKLLSTTTSLIYWLTCSTETTSPCFMNYPIKKKWRTADIPTLSTEPIRRADIFFLRSKGHLFASKSTVLPVRPVRSVCEKADKIGVFGLFNIQKIGYV